MPPASAKNKTARFILFITGLVVVLVIAVVVTNGKWKWLSRISEPKYETPALSPDYLPSDTGAVLRLNLRELENAKFVKKELPFLQFYFEDHPPHELQNSLGFDMNKDVDWIQLTLMAGNMDHPLVMASSKFDVAKFKPAPNGLREVNKPGARYRLYEWPASDFIPALTLALGDNLLLLCDKPSRVTDALEDTATGRKPALDDATLAELLKKVDRKQTIWGAASLKKLSPIPRLEPAVEGLLRPIMQNTDAIYGGINCGDDAEGTIYFLASSDEKATALEQQLRDLVKVVPLGTVFAPTQIRPLLKLLGAGEVSRVENTVILRSQLSEKK
jgi:hypothetical protein